MKKQGKIKSIPVSQVEKGMQVITMSTIFKVSEKCNDTIILKSVNGNLKIDGTLESLKLKKLVIVYEEKNEKYTEIPLKYSQWSKAMYNHEVDTEKLINFEIIEQVNKLNNFVCGKIIPEVKNSKMYRLMIYFAHSTMIMYEKTIISDKDMSVEAFHNKNKDVMTRVCEEAINIMEYELSHNQIMKACYVYLVSKNKPQSVYEKEAYTTN